MGSSTEAYETQRSAIAPHILTIIVRSGSFNTLYNSERFGNPKRKLIHNYPSIAHNGLQLQEVGDFEAQNCLPAQNLIRSTKLHLTAELPIS
jgi:hypothetical protein